MLLNVLVFAVHFSNQKDCAALRFLCHRESQTNVSFDTRPVVSTLYSYYINDYGLNSLSNCVINLPNPSNKATSALTCLRYQKAIKQPRKVLKSPVRDFRTRSILVRRYSKTNVGSAACRSFSSSEESGVCGIGSWSLLGIVREM